MVSGRGVNTKSVFTRTDPTETTTIPTETLDGQLGYNIETRRHWGIKLHNPTGTAITSRVLGYTFEDKALETPVTLTDEDVVVQDGESEYIKGDTPGIARIQLEIDGAGAASGDLKAVFGSSREP